VLRGTNGSVAFIFVRAVRRPLSFLRGLAQAVLSAPSGSGIHLVQKRELTSSEIACVSSVSGPVHIHSMHASEAEAGPHGGRECSGYIFWLARHWHALPAHMLFMHEEPPDSLTAAALADALASPRGFVNLLAAPAAVLRCFAPPIHTPAHSASSALTRPPTDLNDASTPDSKMLRM